MPCAYWTYPDENVLVKRYIGHVTPQCVLQLMDRIDRDPSYRPGMVEFDDMRHVTELDLTVEDVARFAEMMKWLSTRFTTPTAKAIVAPDLVVRVAVYEFTVGLRKTGMHQIGIFPEVDTALAFLGLEKSGLGDILREDRLAHH